jgi:hypothetical protein
MLNSQFSILNSHPSHMSAQRPILTDHKKPPKAFFFAIVYAQRTSIHETQNEK